jgi:hypothetical protein
MVLVRFEEHLVDNTQVFHDSGPRLVKTSGLNTPTASVNVVLATLKCN